MSTYCTIVDLVERFSPDEVLARGWPMERYRYAGEVSDAGTWAASSPAPAPDDVVWDGAAFQRAELRLPVALSVARIDLAIADATRRIDASLAARYTLPLDASDAADLTREAADMARYALYDDAPTETVRKRYEDAVARLARLADGREILPGTAGAGGASALAVGDAELGTVPPGPWTAPGGYL